MPFLRTNELVFIAVAQETLRNFIIIVFDSWNMVFVKRTSLRLISYNEAESELVMVLVRRSGIISMLGAVSPNMYCCCRKPTACRRRGPLQPL